MARDAYYMIGDVADATGETVKNIRQWLQRGVLVAGGSIWPAGQKTPRLFSARTAYEIAITSMLVEHGFAAGRAAKAAMHFAHGGGEDLNTGAPGTDDPSAMRRGGDLFAQGETFLLVASDPDKDRVAKVSPRDPAMPLVMGGPVTALHLNPIIKNVRDSLGITE